jgi:predicted ATPase
VDRAEAVAPDFALVDTNAADVATVCVKLEGLPLAIELAAARSRHLTPGEMLAALQSRLKLLTGGERDRPMRHRTLHAAIEWSYTLLTAHEQRLFRTLAVFVESFTADAVQAIVGEDSSVRDVLTSLVDKHLVKEERLAGGVSRVRFRMLETIREYALTQLLQAATVGSDEG